MLRNDVSALGSFYGDGIEDKITVTFDFTRVYVGLDYASECLFIWEGESDVVLRSVDELST